MQAAAKEDAANKAAAAGSQSTCFTSTKVQILTPEDLRSHPPPVSSSCTPQPILLVRVLALQLIQPVVRRSGGGGSRSGGGVGREHRTRQGCSRR
jgi:hypothetical protein